MDTANSQAGGAPAIRSIDKLAYRINELPYAAGIGRTKAYGRSKQGG